METDINPLFIITVFAAGVLSFFSPCILPLLPVYIAKLMDGQQGKKIKILGLTCDAAPLVKTALFILGISFVFFSLGLLAGAVGHLFYHPYTSVILGAVVILLGLHQMEWINFTFLQRERKIEIQNTGKGYTSAFLLGLTFSFGWTPCVGPVLGSVLALSAAGGHSAWYGGLLTAVYTLGMAIPFLLLALASSRVMKALPVLKKHTIQLKKIGGLIIILMGILLMMGELHTLSIL